MRRATSTPCTPRGSRRSSCTSVCGRSHTLPTRGERSPAGRRARASGRSDAGPRRQAGVSDAVAVLRRKGLVARDPESRTAALSLTTGGQTLADGLAAWDQRTREQLADLPVADKHATLRLLLDLVAGLQRSGAITDARMCMTCRFFRRNAHPNSDRPHHCALVTRRWTPRSCGSTAQSTSLGLPDRLSTLVHLGSERPLMPTASALCRLRHRTRPAPRRRVVEPPSPRQSRLTTRGLGW